MDALDILQYVWNEAGGPGTQPSNITGLSGFDADCMRWVHTSWRWVQGLRQDWWWKWVSSTETLVIDQNVYDPSPDWSITDARTFRLEDFVLWDSTIGVSDQTHLAVLSVDDWRERYDKGTQTANRPSHVAFLEDGKIGIGVQPDKTYSLRVRYYQETSDFSTASDIPGIPLEYHDLIAYKALSMWAMREVNIPKYQYFEQEVSRWQKLLMADPRIGHPYGVATGNLS